MQSPSNDSKETGRENVAAGIVLFSPNVAFLKENIECLLKQVDHVFLVDNTEEKDGLKSVFLDDPNVTYVSDGVNKGIAKALNLLMELAEEKEYKWLLTLDQDSVVPEDFISDLMAFAVIDKIAIIAPCYIDRNSGRQFGYDGLVETCITSGSLCLVEAWRSVGGFDEYMFIDMVDHEYCFRLRNADWKIYQTKSIVLNHAVGDSEYKTIFGYECCVMNHSAFRKYYQMRNSIYFDKKRGKFSPRASLICCVAWSVKVLLWEDDKINKIKAMIKGAKDGFLSHPEQCK